ncbi:UNKNOWN [Stylonychia lemnae]|uniref:Uncharacterized protein n=1 Tax=Stylonychia lemnae TaxID=5949 RepID=A0A078B6A7_STYLE|nr:UNKNOWN [Stylonychia lemnae]|eukprot:CDW89083.1 UNKNOWN [Stylonychia lemnae]
MFQNESQELSCAQKAQVLRKLGADSDVDLGIMLYNQILFGILVFIIIFVGLVLFCREKNREEPRSIKTERRQVIERQSNINKLLNGRRGTNQSVKHQSTDSNKPVKISQVFESGLFSKENRIFRELKEEHKSAVSKNTESINEDSYEQLSKFGSRSLTQTLKKQSAK